MNRLYGENLNGHILMCVLEPGNIHKLVQEQKPIEICLNEGMWKNGLPAKVTVALMYSETPVADSKQLRSLLAPDGLLIDSRTPASKSKLPHCSECKSTIEQIGIFRNESPIAFVMCPACGCVLGTVPSDTVKGLEP